MKTLRIRTHLNSTNENFNTTLPIQSVNIKQGIIINDSLTQEIITNKTYPLPTNFAIFGFFFYAFLFINIKKIINIEILLHYFKNFSPETYLYKNALKREFHFYVSKFLTYISPLKSLNYHLTKLWKMLKIFVWCYYFTNILDLYIPKW